MGKPTGSAQEQQRALGRLKSLPALRGFYLALGSAIGWHLHHRRSNALDLGKRANSSFDHTQVRRCAIFSKVDQG